jgi:hypothetical protein
MHRPQRLRWFLQSSRSRVRCGFHIALTPGVLNAGREVISTRQRQCQYCYNGLRSDVYQLNGKQLVWPSVEAE